MSTQIEERLSAAFRARAEQITQTDLAPADHPVEAGPAPRRQMAYAALAAAGIAAAVVVPLTIAAHDDSSPAPAVPSTSTPGPTTSPSATGPLPRSGFDLDIDGDGRPDKVQVGATGGFKVFLAADPSHPLVKRLSADTFITGAADVGTPGQALVVATSENGDLLSLTHTVWTVRDGQLLMLPTADGAILGGDEFSRTFVRGGVLYTSAWGGNSPQQGTIEVPTSSWRLVDGVLTPTRVDDAFCTDPGNRDVMPAPCQGGQVPALGSKVGLPTLYPTLRDASVTEGVPMDLPDGGTLEIKGGSLVAVTPSGRSSVPLAHPGMPAALSVVPMTDHDSVYLVVQESGDAQVFSAYRSTKGQLTLLTGDPSLPLVDGPGRGGSRQHTWQSAAGDVYTAVTHDPTDTTHFTLYTWGVDGDHLEATKVGPVCLDMTNQDYGDCAT